MEFKDYGYANVNEDLVYPTEIRARSLEQYKKSMSQFMVSSYPYNDKYKTGNSTKLKQASTLLNLVKKCKVVQGNRKASQACKSFNDKDFVQIMGILEESNNVGKNLFCSAVYRYQVAHVV